MGPIFTVWGHVLVSLFLLLSSLLFALSSPRGFDQFAAVLGFSSNSSLNLKSWWKGPNRVNRAHGPTKENRETFEHFLAFFQPMKSTAWNGTKWEPGRFFSCHSRPCQHLGQNGFGFWTYLLMIFWIPHFLISRSPDLKIPRFLDFQVPAMPFGS